MQKSTFFQSRWKRHSLYMLISFVTLMLLLFFIGEMLPAYLVYITSSAIFLVGGCFLVVGTFIIWKLSRTKQAIMWARCKGPFISGSVCLLMATVYRIQGKGLYRDWLYLQEHSETPPSSTFFLFLLFFVFHTALWSIVRFSIQFYHSAFPVQQTNKTQNNPQKEDNMLLTMKHNTPS